ncbi:UNVERIFIED_CONTAM: hypothetical protein PYX00_011718 [Menopon gallinae]|uniref:LNS2/PITP domain-containing protein n=1 Tax=Menopon gallinae TaxID=328185 RepID=A0AAW2H8I5_9NEOP
MIALTVSLLLVHAACSSRDASAVDISCVNRTVVFAKLFNNAQRSRPWFRRRTMKPSEAVGHVGEFREDVDGVVMRVRVPTEEEDAVLDARAYDEEYGAGAAERVVQKLRRKMGSTDAYGSSPIAPKARRDGEWAFCGKACAVCTGTTLVGAASGICVGACCGATFGACANPYAGAAIGACAGSCVGTSACYNADVLTACSGASLCACSGAIIGATLGTAVVASLGALGAGLAIGAYVGTSVGVGVGTSIGIAIMDKRHYKHDQHEEGGCTQGVASLAAADPAQNEGPRGTQKRIWKETRGSRIGRCCKAARHVKHESGAENQPSMEMASGFVSTMFGLYKDINPSTLSGVNDIVVVEGHDGVLRCSPFHVRFGKMQMFRITSRVVHLYVNGVMSDIVMIIGKQGELYFEVDEACSAAENCAHLSINYAEDAPGSRGCSSDLEIIPSAPSARKAVLRSPTPPVCDSAACERGVQGGGLYTRKYVEHERAANFEKRRFSMRRSIAAVDPYQRLCSMYSTFDRLVNSFEYLDFSLSNAQVLLHVLKGLWMYPVRTEARCTEGLDEGCVEAGVRFSLCGGERMGADIDAAFEGCEVQQIRDHDRLIARVSGCRRCGTKFYFSFGLFAELHFLARTLLQKRGQEGVLRDLIEKEREKRKGWSLFTRSRPEKKVVWSLELTSDQLRSLNLRHGANNVVFKLSGINQKLEAKIFLWGQDEKIIISDIDGTITKSDVRGHIYSFVGKDWTHKGVAHLYTRIARNGYRILYLTTRPLGQSAMTRFYLKNVEQDGGRLPEGPILHSPDGLFAALYREIISRNPQSFKIACLKKIQSLFNGEFPFVSGFGNKLSDVITYKTLGIPTSKIFTINPQGNVILELTRALTATHQSLNSFVDSMFPNLNSGVVVNFDNQFTDAEFWKFPDSMFYRR